MVREAEPAKKVVAGLAWGSFAWCIGEPDHPIAFDGFEPGGVRRLRDVPPPAPVDAPGRSMRGPGSVRTFRDDIAQVARFPACHGFAGWRAACKVFPPRASTTWMAPCNGASGLHGAAAPWVRAL